MKTPVKSKHIAPVNAPQKSVQKVEFNDRRQDTKSLNTIQKKANKTGLPDQLKSGIEALSGYSMDDVKVHYNSRQPAQLQAHAFAQGNQIHLGPGQEKHLPHEAWHVVQQKQGRVSPTVQYKSVIAINDDASLEREADEMGTRALKIVSHENPIQKKDIPSNNRLIQLATDIKYGGLVAFPFRYGSDDAPTNVNAGNRVATRMKAHLDPTDVKTGSDTNSSNAFNTLFSALQDHTPTSWVRGHLLNHDLGGIAKPNNLFPITTAANGEHYHEVEKIVKHWVASKAEVDYSVTAQKTSGDARNPSGSFRCVASVTKAPVGSSVAGAMLDKTINSIVNPGDEPKETFTRRYAKKPDKEVTKFASVVINDAASVLRDVYRGKFKKDANWNHRAGVVGDNEEQASNIDEDLAPSVTTQLQLAQHYVNPQEDLEIIEEIHKEILSGKLNVENAFDLFIEGIEEDIAKDIQEVIERTGVDLSDDAITELINLIIHLHITNVIHTLQRLEEGSSDDDDDDDHDDGKMDDSQ